MRVQKHLIFVVSFLAVALIHSSHSGFEAFAEPKDPNFDSGHCVIHDDLTVTCCWQEPDLNNPGEEVSWCQTCNLDPTDCGPLYSSTGPFAPPQDGILDEPPTPPPSGPAAPLQDGGILQQPPDLGGTEPPTGDQGILPQDSILQQQQQQQQPADQGEAELPPTTEETQPATVEEEPPVPVCQEGLEFNEDLGFCVPAECPDGQVLDEQTGVCVLEEQPAAAEEPQVEEPTEPQSDDEEQTSDQEDNSEDNNSNN